MHKGRGFCLNVVVGEGKEGGQFAGKGERRRVAGEVLAILAGVLFKQELDSELTILEHLNTHLIIEFNTNEQMIEHRSTDRTITTFESKLLLSVC
ncbi:hypothetical protein L6452_40423 [Arctium lappa]|uniref:Uncharacterized protein n=1 Tax=Arctium lappa TaxID=4217 RepID=A0ACB8XLB0_ARCLA|nr:hypothetical protein L6452_40423 [Arctium lappa]